MGSNSRLLATVAATAMLAGCAGSGGTIPLTTAITAITQPVTATACTGSQARPSDLGAKLLADFPTVSQAIKDRLTQSDPPATAVIDTVIRALGSTLDANTSPTAANTQLTSAPPLTLDSIRQFAKAVHQKAISAPAPTAQPADATVRLALQNFNEILVTYVTAYVEGKYVDRFGNTLTAPVFSRTVGDTEIAGIVSVIADAIADDLLQTPIWVDNTDKPTKYYPAFFNAGTGTAAANAAKGAAGGGTTQSPKPTAATVMVNGQALFKPVALVNQGTTQNPTTHGTQCGIDALKAEAIEYLGQVAALKASAAGGFAAADFGGFGISFGGYLKISVGDNQTVQTLAKTLLAKIAERIAAEGAYRVLYRVDDSGSGDLAELLLHVLEKQQSTTSGTTGS